MNNDIRTFFEHAVLPLHDGHKLGLNTAFRTSAQSYFVSPQRPDCLYLNTIPTDNETELENYLKEFWKATPELHGIIPELVRMAFQLREDSSEQTTDLSPFVYAMF